MAGTNPYLKHTDVPKPVQKYTVTFLPENTVVEVDPDAIPYGRTGQPGSILDIALDNGIDLEHSCGGLCACSTCHVIVHEGLASIPEASEDEEDMLDNAPGLTPNSRLACQSVPDGSANLVVEVPEWNRNAIKEGPH